MNVGRRITPELRTLIEHYADQAIARGGPVEIPGHDLMVVPDVTAVELFASGARVNTMVVRREESRMAHVFALVDGSQDPLPTGSTVGAP